jgi:hypothetical protein
MKHVLIQNCQPTCYFIPLRSKHYPQYPVLKITDLVLHTGVRDQVSWPYVIMDNINISVHVNPLRRNVCVT